MSKACSVGIIKMRQSNYSHLFEKYASMRLFNILEYYGKNSLVVLGFHIIIKNILQKSTEIIGYNVEPSYYFVSIMIISNLIILLLPIHIVNNYFTFILGKSTLEISSMSGDLGIPEGKK